MIYRDTTYCASAKCKNECERKLTDEVRDELIEAEYWICMAYFCDEFGNFKGK